MRRLDLPRVFVDESSTKILMAALKRPRTGLDISRITGVPVAEAFCRLKLLEKKGLVEVVHHIMADGRTVATYRSSLHYAYVFVEDGRVKVRFALGSYEETDSWEGEAALL